MTNKKQFLLFVASYVGWFVCIYAGKYQLEVYSYLVPVLYLFLLHSFSKISKKQTLAFTLLFSVGFLFDSISLQLGWIQLVNSSISWGLPHWLVSMWLLFVFSIPLYSGWLARNYKITAILGLILGPLTYYSGTTFEVLLIEKNASLIIYGIFWGLYFPFSLWLYQKLKT